MQQQKQVEMTEGQLAIVTGLKAGIFDIDPSKPHTTTLRAIRVVVPDKDDEWIWGELANWEGVEKVGLSLEDKISIPGKYFK